jgi:ABC-type transport system involved in cytochrome c biogenesis permease component
MSRLLFLLFVLSIAPLCQGIDTPPSDTVPGGIIWLAYFDP